MHIYVAGIGGSGLGPLAKIALDLGYRVSGSDIVESEPVKALRQQGVTINIGHQREQIAKVDRGQPIDWYVYSSALPKQALDNPELAYVQEKGIRHSKRDQFLVEIIKQHKFKLVAASGTHGKTTTTAMTIWLLQELGLDISYSLGGEFYNAPAARASRLSQWFVYEADEYDRNFLAYRPDISLITGLGHDHHDIYPKQADYDQAFADFINQSKQVFIWQTDLDKLAQYPLTAKLTGLKQPDPRLKLVGLVNRLDAELAARAGAAISKRPRAELYQLLNNFPGLKRRFEQLAPNVYTDYAHTPEKIAGCLDIANQTGQPVVVVYEPHSNVRQHHIRDHYQDLFAGVKQLYWLPTYSAREKSDLKLLTPIDFIDNLTNSDQAEPAQMNDSLKAKLMQHAEQGDLVVAMSAGSLDNWLRQNFKNQA